MIDNLLANRCDPDIGPTALVLHCSRFHFDIGSTSLFTQLPTVIITMN